MKTLKIVLVALLLVACEPALASPKIPTECSESCFPASLVAEVRGYNVYRFVDTEYNSVCYYAFSDGTISCVALE